MALRQGSQKTLKKTTKTHAVEYPCPENRKRGDTLEPKQTHKKPKNINKIDRFWAHFWGWGPMGLDLKTRKTDLSVRENRKTRDT